MVDPTDPSAPVSIADLSGEGVLKLARRHPEAARQSLRGLGVEAQVQACLEVRPQSRPEFLMLLDHPEEIVPHLPEAELCVTARASGMSETAWLLEMATSEQVQACFDLDCWVGSELSHPRVEEWLSALVEAGEETMVRAIEAVDPEVWILALRSAVDVMVISKEEIPPDGWFTLDGVVYLGPHERVDPSLFRGFLDVAFRNVQARYWQWIYGVLFEHPTECEEFALRWRTGRLADLGFPELDQAMRVYRPLRPEDAPVWDVSTPQGALVPAPRLPRQVEGTLLAEALGKLPPQRAADLLGYVLAVANAIAVADKLELSAVESIPQAVSKAVRGIDRGLRELARTTNRPAHEVLDTTRPMDLFRIGFLAG